jgi:sterol desaturase/sphingolipid hydroxylase (fatty acid hydroxylase superfamily)
MTTLQYLGRPPLAVGGFVVRFFTRQPPSPWPPIVFYVPLGAAAVVWNVYAGTPAWALAALPAAGLFLWTLLEYILHKVAFHQATRFPRLIALYGSHGSHHVDPKDPERIVTRLSFSGMVAVILWAITATVLWSVRLSALVMVGVMAGYLAYEVVHFAIHRARGFRRILRPLVRHHLYHHHKDDTRCFGVTTPLWDWIFRTDRPWRRAAPQEAGEAGELG